jgi:hypothetical protein
MRMIAGRLNVAAPPATNQPRGRNDCQIKGSFRLVRAGPAVRPTNQHIAPPLLSWPHGSLGDAKHRPETRGVAALLTMRVKVGATHSDLSAVVARLAAFAKTPARPYSSVLLSPLSSPDLIGRSSIPEAAVLESRSRSVLDARWSLSSGSPKARPGGGHDD